MTIEETVADLLEAYLTGYRIQHYCHGREYAFIVAAHPRSGRQRTIFRHEYDDYASTISITLTLSDAIEVVKRYWKRRLPNAPNH
jgi:hypothetical protein